MAFAESYQKKGKVGPNTVQGALSAVHEHRKKRWQSSGPYKTIIPFSESLTNW